MFTGIVEEIGRVSSLSTGTHKEEQYQRCRISCSKVLGSIKIGDSIALNGCCQTVVDFHKPLFGGKGWFEVETWNVSMQKTNLKYLKPESPLNLERAVCLNSRIGGHLVSGHVDKTVEVSHVDKRGDNHYLYLSLDSEDLEYIVSEGSITVDGVSLTLAQIERGKIVCNIISHTYLNTIINTYTNGTKVNIEFDMILKYSHALLSKWYKNKKKDEL